ncbi:phosphatase PAP2 family protein [Halomonas icarae]|uniref:undecaprenyl-diphosphate phosphatase n=1 Tax=Halomonas icarae TaxID=2691040 RepID=A0A7X4W0Z5_9GAMM|nr:phosphatase PAP2 family protein [Halomonas icarae]MDR5900557.1 phosphatase PAP2 family protein [Halomonas icarae]NAW13969.1 phosphatase PAP2 family protein [Halomonas icarae]
MKPRAPAAFERLDLLEWQLCQRIARLSLYRPWLATLRLASKLGDWPAWVALIAAQPWLHEAGHGYLLQYSLTALAAIVVYRLIKTRLCRERPFITFGTIPCREPARDRYSFPSGHTLHAVLFCTLSAAHTPALLPLLLPLATLIALSRIGLGLHYLSDVIAGGLIGYAFALASLALLG